MTNECNEFKAYTDTPVYAPKSKKDNSFLGRFTLDMIQKNIGFQRILTTLARGYLFHNPDGTPKDGDAYSRTDYARRALCAWCSIPDKKKTATPDEEWRFESDFKELHGEFPELVDENGGGWYYRHIHALADFIAANREKVNKSTYCIYDRIAEFDEAWRKKVIQFQVPIFSPNTKAEWLLRFDDAVADALELGELRREAYILTEEQEAWVVSVTPKGVPISVMRTLTEYYLANKTEDGEWIVLPETNIEAFLGSTSLKRQYLPKIPKEVLQRKETSLGVSMYKVIH